MGGMRYLGWALVSLVLYGCGSDASDVGMQDSALLASPTDTSNSQEYYTVEWDLPLPGNDVHGYKLYAGLASRQYVVHRDVGNVASVRAFLPRTRTWYVAITAYNAAGESPFSQEVAVPPRP